MTIILYARVSTAEQTLAHQETQARAAGYAIDHVIADEGVSGVATKLVERPQGRRLHDLLRSGDTLVVRWIDRLGRDYEDVCTTIREFLARGVTIQTVINSMTFDGAPSDPIQRAVRDALIGFMAAMAQSQAEATKVAQRAGIEHAKTQGDRYRGRKPSYDRNAYDLVLSLASSGHGASSIAAATNLTRQTVLRIRNDPAQADAVLRSWGG